MALFRSLLLTGTIFALSDDRFATAMMFKTVFDLDVEMRRRHCEERSDEAIHLSPCGAMDCFALLAMTWRGSASHNSRHRAQFTFGIQIAQLAFENLPRRFARHGVHELDVL